MNENLTSKTISFLRLPLAVGIVLQHCYYFGQPTEPTAIFRGWLSWTMGSIGVPVFFVMSGYLFFLQFPETEKWLSWSWRTYCQKLLRRTGSLLLPYLLWNLLTIVYSGVPFDWHMLWNSAQWHVGMTNFLGQPIAPDTSPISGVLWFVRDLMILSVLSPLVYLAVRYLGVYFLALVLVCRTASCPGFIPGQMYTALLFFSIGAWLSVSKRDLAQTAQAWWRKWMLLVLLTSPAWAMLDDVALTVSQGPKHIFLTLFVFYIGSLIASRIKGNISSFWTQSAMVVYAAHAGLGVLNIVASFAEAHAFPPFATYLFVPFASVLLILACYYPVWRFLPGVSNALTGKVN